MICSKCGKECNAIFSSYTQKCNRFNPSGIMSDCCNAEIKNEEKPEIIQISREQAISMANMATTVVSLWREKGFIKQSNLEKAEDMWKSIQSTFNDTGQMTSEIFRVANDYIRELKKEGDKK